MSTDQDYLNRINALRTMSLEEYESTVDELVEELDAAGLLAKYDALLLEIDESFDTEHDEAVKELMEALTAQQQEPKQ